VNDLYPLKLHNFVIIRTLRTKTSPAWLYVGKILDMYEKGASGCYGSVLRVGNASSLQALSVRVYLPLQINGNGDDGDEHKSPMFSSTLGPYHLHSYAPIDTLMYHLSPRALVPLAGDKKARMELDGDAETHWKSFSKQEVVKELPKILIRVRGGKAA